MIACVDVHYSAQLATAACVVFADWQDEDLIEEHLISEPISAEYEPGKLYLRELPPILSILGAVDGDIDRVIVDGNVWLDDDGRPGLGARLFDALGAGRVAVIGVAKSFFFEGDRVVPVKRGGSERPLYVTAAGIDVAEAAEQVRTMRGEFRLPENLKRADSLCRGNRQIGDP